MKTQAKPITILMADDDADDCYLIQEALSEAKAANDLKFVHDGQELIEYLTKQGEYANGHNAPRPSLILLDLNMPRKNGQEALKEIKADPHLRSIPVVVLTTSKSEEDILQTYDLGVAGFITKPVSFDGLVQSMNVLCEYWLQIVALPKR